MARTLAAIPTFDSASGLLRVVIETPRGGRTKLAYDPELGALVVKRVLPQGMVFPFDFGFIPSTLGEDGDPLDVLVLMDEVVPAGCIVPCRPIGIIEAIQSEDDGSMVENSRLIAVADASDLYESVKELSDLPTVVLTQVEHFFVSYNEQRGHVFDVTGRKGRVAAQKQIEL
jgi:inorganic pyrophosphatase